MTQLYSQLNRDLLTGTLSVMRGRLLSTNEGYAKVVASNTLPRVELREKVSCDMKPLPEDYFIRGSVWEDLYFPATWFDNDSRDYDERVSVEGEWMDLQREIRCVWLGGRLIQKIGW